MAEVVGSNPSGRLGGQTYALDLTGEYTAPQQVTDGPSGGVLVQCVVDSSWGGTLTFQQSVDGTNWTAALMTNLASAGTATTAIAAGLFRTDASGGMFRVYCTQRVFGAMNVTVVPYTG